MPPLKKPWKLRRAQEAERRAVREMEREIKEAKDKEKEVIKPFLASYCTRISHYLTTLGSFSCCPGCRVEFAFH